ncbi:hypothetical protein JI747_011420 [Chryseobacterium sp. RG1]|uniref:Uncharacterized protein n=1 Tax=Chryseobacterium tagetis TaxID=2801334 RepID=A0ABS8A1C5_9FLAO|nr:hypothetical protein [Chryseobacterium tagetis]MCA6067791.1 hypothetical protein [Chryseobacterium tagetis]
MIFLFLANVLSAQIGLGIGTYIPQGIFHVDPRQNTSLSVDSTKTDDFVVDFSGNVGVGTLTPQAKLDINAGRIAIRDGSEGQGKILISDAEGKGTWSAAGDNGKTGLWSLTGNLTYLNNDGLKLLQGTASLPENEIGLQIDPVNSSSNIIVPAGLYLILVELRLINTNEYGKMEIHLGSGQTLNNKMYEIYYRVNLKGSAFMHYFPQNSYVHMGVNYFPYNTNNLYTQMPIYDPPPFNAVPFEMHLRFIKLNY